MYEFLRALLELVWIPQYTADEQGKTEILLERQEPLICSMLINMQHHGEPQGAFLSSSASIRVRWVDADGMTAILEWMPSLKGDEGDRIILSKSGEPQDDPPVAMTPKSARAVLARVGELLLPE